MKNYRRANGGVNHGKFRVNLVLRYCLVTAIACFLGVGSSASAADKPAVKVIAVAELKRSSPVDFQREILPIFKTNCLACHNKAKGRGDLILESPQTIMEGSESGDVVIPGDGIKSLLVRSVRFQEKPFMPPVKNKVSAKPLTPQQIALIKLWIDQGAKGKVTSLTGPVQWQALPAGLNPIYALAISPDGQYVAAGRSNQIFIYHIQTKQLLTRLTDPALLKSGYAKKPGIAHRDLVQSLEFSPDGKWLASGGYRVVNLWQVPSGTQKINASVGAVASRITVSPDGNMLAMLAGDKVKLVDLKTGKPVRELAGHAGAITDVKFAASGKQLLTGGADKSIRVWDAATGKQVGRIDTSGEVTAVAWAAKDLQLVSAVADNKLYTWNTADASKPPVKKAPAKAPAKEGEKKGGKKDETKDEGVKPLKVIAGHSARINCLVASPVTATQVLSGSDDSTARHWDITAGKQVRQINAGAPVVDLVLSPDGKRFAAAGKTGNAKIWNISDGKIVAELKQSRKDTLSLASSLRYTVLANKHVGYYKSRTDATAKRVKAEQDAVKKSTEAHKKAVTELPVKQEAFNKVKTAKENADKAHEASKKLVAELTAKRTQLTKDQQAAVAAQKVAQANQTKSNAASQKATQVKVAADRKVTEATQQKTQGEQKVAQAKAAAAKDAKNEALKKAQTDAEKALVPLVGIESKAKSAATLAAGEATKLLQAKAEVDKAKGVADAKLADVNKTKAATDKAFSTADAKRRKDEAEVKKQEKPFNAASAALEAAMRAKSSADNALAGATKALKRAQEQEVLAKSRFAAAEAGKKEAGESHQALVKQVAATAKANTTARVAFSHDGAVLYTAGAGNVIESWSAATGESLSRYQDQTSGGAAVTALASLAGGGFVTAGANQKIVSWNSAGEWKLARQLGDGSANSPLSDRVISLAFHPDSNRLATGGGYPSRSGEVKIWDIAKGQMVKEVKDAHSDTVFGMEFSFDGTHLATCGADKFMKTWKVDTGEHVRSFEGHTHHVLDVSWSADGRTLVTCGADSIVKVWDFLNGGQKKTVTGYTKEVTRAMFIGVGDTFLTTAGDKQVRVVKDSGQNVRSFSGVTDFIYAAAVTADGKYIAAGGQGGVVRIWDGTNGKVIANFESPKPAIPQAASK